MIYDPTPRLVKIGDALSQLVNVIWPFWDHRDTTANESISGAVTNWLTATEVKA